MKKHLLYILLAGIFLLSCSKEENPLQNNASSVNELFQAWEVPIDQLVLSSLPPDRIPSIDHPQFETLISENVNTNEIAYVFRSGDIVKVYPLSILAVHEIVNDRIGDHYFTVSYCPLTGSALAWNREIDGYITEFGVSGHLFNDNLIPYDRNTNNYWSQMQLQSIKGSKSGDALNSEFLLTTSLETVLKSFPNALILMDSTTHDCDSICGGLKQSKARNNDYFGIINKGIAHADEALLFSDDLFSDSIRIYKSQYAGQKLLIIGSKLHQFTTAFIDNTGDPDIQFYAIQNLLPIAFADSNGNNYDLTGLVISGPSKGKRLSSPLSYSAHNFAWELFYKDEIELF